MKFQISHNTAGSSGTKIATRCPHCGHYGTFEVIINDLQDNGSNRTFGIRRCPNPNCSGHLFFVYNRSNSTITLTYPSETIPFDKSGIPEKVLNAFDEAIICHSNSCFVASAIMIRKTLEEICSDREAKGTNLFKRLEDLGSKILVPKELIEGMQELRLLGNDAAHIEANTFNEVGKNEIEVSIEFTKEILKAVYQYEGLLTKIRGLRKPSE
jgi:hypothetical protein